LVDLGATPATVQAQLGHSDPRITLSGYTHAVEKSQREAVERLAEILISNDAKTVEELFQQADVWPGQSGGPFFGWWSGEPWPRVVGVQSAQNPQTNLAGAGNDIPSLVIQARSDFPSSSERIPRENAH
jgi:hypothetical protein